MRIAVAGATGRLGRHVVDVLNEEGHDVVPMSRATGVDVVSGDGLADALTGVEVIIDVATGPSPDEKEATEFFLAATKNLQEQGERAGVKQIVVVSIVNTDQAEGGYNAAKVAQERAMLAGPIPVKILRAAQFHEFVEQLVDWGRQGDVSYVWRMRTQLVAARVVAEELVRLALDPEPAKGQISDIAGPRAETLAEMARLLVQRRGEDLRIEEVDSPMDTEAYASGGLLPGPDAKLAGPTFEEWLAA
jgi:uncharacterized protein YbjT (DUF2867 family)